MSIFARRLQGVSPPNKSIKNNYGGLFTSTEANRASWTPPLGQYWLKVKWSDLEPNQGTYDWSSIDSYLVAHPTLNVRIHVLGGQLAPVSGTNTWLADISGGTVDVTNVPAGITVPCGMYWKQPYMNAYATFVKAMGARYDSNPQVASINNAGCSLVFDEPWIMGGDTTSCVNMYNAGLSKIAQHNAIYNALDALMAAWPTTIIEMPTHSQLNYPISTGQGGDWMNDGLPAINMLHTTYGHQLILTDYGLGAGEYEAAAPDLATALTQYSWMHLRSTLGFPIAFQATFRTTTQAIVESGTQAAIDMGGRWFEHSSWGALPNNEVQSYDSALKANVRP